MSGAEECVPRCLHDLPTRCETRVGVTGQTVRTWHYDLDHVRAKVRGDRLINTIWSYTVHRSGATCTVALAGELDMSVREDVAAVLLTELNRPGSTALLADLSDVGFLDSSGIAALIRVRQAAEGAGRRFMITDAHGVARRVLEVTGLWSVLSA